MSTDDSTLHDVIVVGSGFGGAITAMRLARAGRDVVVLERGKRWDAVEYPRTVHEVASSMWDEDEHHGFLDYRVFNRLDVIQGCGVGGGSLHYFNVHLRTAAHIFDRPEWTGPISRDVLDPYYELAEEMCEARPLTPPAGRAMPARTRHFMEAARKAGMDPALVPLALHTGELRRHPHSGKLQGPCDFSSNCLLGCQPRAKNSLDMTYIPAGEAAGMEVRPLHEVDHLAPGPDDTWVLHVKVHGAPGEHTRTTLRARQVVLAAGSLGSTEILLRSRDQARTLPRLPPALGRRFSGNGDMLFAATGQTPMLIDPAHGPSISAGVDVSKPGSPHTVTVQDLGLPAPFFWLLEGLAPGRRRLGTLLGAVGRYIGDALDLDLGGGQIRFEGDQLFEGGRTTNLMPYLGMGTDAADGVMELDPEGRLDIDWDPEASKEMFDEMDEAMARLSDALGGRHVRSLLWRWPARRLLTAHPLGGCPMGLDPVTSVVDHRGRVHGHPGLYVIDSAMIPGPLAVNPSATISALAERAVHWMLHGEDLRPGRPGPT